MGIDKWSLLSKLRRAVKKVKFILSFSIHRWRLAYSTILSPHRRMSYGDRPGLRACADDPVVTENATSGSGSFERVGSALQRTTSCPSEDDIDKRAEMFIANFHRQLQIERQISLELHYCRENSFDSISP